MKKIQVNHDIIEISDEEYNRLFPENKIPPEQEIEMLKNQLAESDYKAIKYAEGWMTEEEFAPYKAKRQRIRNRINELENEIVEKPVENV